MPKFDPLQGDFSAGEITPRVQGDVSSAIYKAGMARLANVMPTRGRSFASRAGGKWIRDAIAIDESLTEPGASGTSLTTAIIEGQGLPVQHLPVQDGPYGDFVIEVGQWYLRIMDKTGVLPWHVPLYDLRQDGPVQFDSGAWRSDTPGYPDVWGDYKSGTLYLNNETGSGQRIVGTDFIANYEATGTPAGTDGTWNFTGKLAGDGVTLRIQLLTGETQDFPLSRGAFLINFAPRTGVGADNQFKLLLISGLNGRTGASSLWDLRLEKSGSRQTSDIFLGAVSAADRIRASPGFWANGQFYVVLVGLSGGPYALRWTKPANAARLDPVWDFAPLNYAVTDAGFVASNVVTVTAYQNRLWFGMGDEQGSMYATMVGYGLANAHTTGGAFQFKFGSIKNSKTTLTGLVGENYYFDFPITWDPAQDAGTVLSVKVDGVAVALAGYSTFPDTSQAAGRSDTGGIVRFLAPYPAIGTLVTIEREGNILASDPLSLKLASPTGRIVWLNVLRGLVLGSTRMEKTFEQGATLALDPATGMAFDILDHSSLGSARELPAINVNEKIIFFQQGRQILRAASVRWQAFEANAPQGGLLTEDVGVLGEHLLSSRCRSFCYLKSPVPRMVFAFDDGTAAVATLDARLGFSWSRFTLNADFLGGIFSVAALDTEDGSQLWVGTESGITLQWDSFESDIQKKYRVSSPAAPPLAPTRTLYDTETPLPPVMDAWVRLPGLASFLTGVTDKSQLPGIMRADSVASVPVVLLVNGQAYRAQTNIDEPSPIGNSINLQSLQSPDGLSDVTQVSNGVDHDLPFTGVFPHPLPFVWLDGANAPRAQEFYVGLAYPEHKAVTLPLEGGNPAGTSQAYTSRRAQLYLRLVDSYAPVVGIFRAPERGPVDPADTSGARITGDVRVTQLGFERGAKLEIYQDLPLRIEISAIFGGTQVNSP